MKTSKIETCSFDKSFKSQFGTLFQHTITLENGDTGQINAKESMPEWLGKGKELNYTITPNGKYPDKIKKENPKFSQEQPKESSGEIQELRNEIEKLKSVIKSLVKANKLIYIEPKSEPKPVAVPTNNNDDLPF